MSLHGWNGAGLRSLVETWMARAEAAERRAVELKADLEAANGCFRVVDRIRQERVAELEAELTNLVFEVMDGPADICCGCDANPRDCEANRSKDPMVEAALKARAVLERKP